MGGDAVDHDTIEAVDLGRLVHGRVGRPPVTPTVDDDLDVAALEALDAVKNRCGAMTRHGPQGETVLQHPSLPRRLPQRVAVDARGHPNPCAGSRSVVDLMGLQAEFEHLLTADEAVLASNVVDDWSVVHRASFPFVADQGKRSRPKSARSWPATGMAHPKPPNSGT